MTYNEILYSNDTKCNIEWDPLIIDDIVYEYYPYVHDRSVFDSFSGFNAILMLKNSYLASINNEEEFLLIMRLFKETLNLLPNDGSLHLFTGLKYLTSGDNGYDAALGVGYYNEIFKYNEGNKSVSYEYNTFFNNNYETPGLIIGTSDSTYNRIIVKLNNNGITFHAVNDATVSQDASYTYSDSSDVAGIIYKRPTQCFSVYNEDMTCHKNYKDNDILCNSNEIHTQQLIQKTVSVEQSLYSMIKGSFNIYDFSRQTKLNWNQSSDRNEKHKTKINIPRHLTRLKPGKLSAAGAGVDVKHGSYNRYLAQKKQKSIRQDKNVTTNINSVVIPKYGNKRYKLGIAFNNYCKCK